uniref:Putative secreted protein n=1 Tax=Panstrongylus lignarius TaxID=156445 RepID=A0A224XWQ2_9HEMI
MPLLWAMSRFWIPSPVMAQTVLNPVFGIKKCQKLQVNGGSDRTGLALGLLLSHGLSLDQFASLAPMENLVSARRPSFF